jgi:hypothetical protein
VGVETDQVTSAKAEAQAREKKKGPPLGFGGPERRVLLAKSFSHRYVGSFRLASLS